MKTNKKHIGIIGSGRFAETLLRIFGKDFNMTVFGREEVSLSILKKKYAVATTLRMKDITLCDAVIFAVPISAFESVLKEYAGLISRKQTLIDVLSVKSHSKNLFKKIMKDKDYDILLTHPMFGPDSSKDGFKDLPIVIDDTMCSKSESLFWKKYFKNKGLKVIDMSAEEHDRLAARSQGLAHFIGRMLEDFKIEYTSIDTLGAQKLLELKEQTCHDTSQLFSDLQHFNPYTKKMRIDLEKSFERLFGKLLPQRVNKDFVTFGIQGGKGSFSEEATNVYIASKNIKNTSIKYLFTSEKVLQELFKGEIDLGICALHNSLGGVVEETLRAVAEHKCKIVCEFRIKIRHFLMKRKDVKWENVTTIMAHSQVFKQCSNNLKSEYPNLKTISGEGDLVDTARAAEVLSKGKLPKNYAILGSSSIAELYDLEIVKGDLQDDEDNYTAFVVLKRA